MSENCVDDRIKELEYAICSLRNTLYSLEEKEVADEIIKDIPEGYFFLRL